MEIDVLTIFPEMFASPLETSILKRAREQGRVQINLFNIRDYSEDKHRAVDDYPYGGGPGMVMTPQVLFAAVEAVRDRRESRAPVFLLSPQGTLFNQQQAQELSMLPRFVLVCGHYEGVDERVRQYLIDEEISIGDYILTGGELAALVVIDAVVRLVPGVLGSGESLEQESFGDGLLEYPQYTKPRSFRGYEVPPILFSGHHAAIARWRRQEALRRTWERRPELLAKARLTEDDKVFLRSLGWPGC